MPNTVGSCVASAVASLEAMLTDWRSSGPREENAGGNEN